LRLAQQYFFVSCSIQDMIQLLLMRDQPLNEVHSYWAVQLNDTHRSIAVAELMRLLVDEHAGSAGSRPTARSGSIATTFGMSRCSTAWRQRRRGNEKSFAGRPSIDGVLLKRPDWSDHSHSLAFTLRSWRAHYSTGCSTPIGDC
jgi:L,D-peptidoglycan transpeptidase YkuD (ErfK/YbiS/YcfS/YnhG family)